MNKSFLPIVLLLVLVNFVSAVGSMTIDPSSLNNTVVNAGDTVTGTINLANIHATDNISINLPASVILSGPRNSENVTLTYNRSTNFSIGSGQLANISYSFTIPSDAFNESYLGTLNFSTNMSGTYAILSINVTVNGSPSLSVPAATLQLIAGTTNFTSINITNTGNTDVNDIILSMGGISGVGVNLTAALSSSSFAIPYQSSKIINITVSAPLDQTVGAYSGQISAGYRNAEKSANATLSVSVLAASRALTTTAATATWVRGISTSAAANTTITNSGNLNISSIVVGLPDLYNGIYMLAKSNIAASPSSTASLLPAQTANIAFTITGVTSSLPNGVYTGTMNVTSAEGTNTTAAFTLTVRNPVYSLSAPSSATFAGTTRNTTTSTSFTITNNGDYAVTGINVSTSATSTAYNVTFSGYSTSLAVGGSTTATVNGFLPLSEDSGSHSIGTIYVRSDQANTTSSLYFNPESKLEINAVRLLVDGKEDSVSNGATGDDKLEPGSRLKVEVEVKNTFTSSEDIKIEDAFIMITAESLEEDDEDVEKETGSFDLKANKKSGTKTFDFGNVSIELEEGSYSIVIYTEGDDEYGARHTAEWTVYVELDKESHDMRIYDFEIEDTTLSCSRITTITPHIYNFGSSREDEAEFTIVNTQLGLSSREKFELENDLSESDSVWSNTYDIDATNLSAGTYPLKMYAYYDGDELDDERIVNIVVKDCATGTTTGGQSYSIDFTATSGRVLTVKANDVIAFSLLNEAHTITINSVGTTSATITISSTPVVLSMNVGETRNVDLNGDGTSDVAVTLHTITSGQALITTTKLSGAGATTTTTTSGDEDDEIIEKPFTESAAFIIILIGAIVIVALLIIVLMVYLMKK
ncbi:MAG: hypothetical protein Q7J54_04115 [Candidatus Woesearchaeota archaeon]|nr:hypothetical protein [Candidatus Woesearchaeota archaeon]